ncbi:secreted RxLR effector protein 161-like [Miscanthus floridulus]|uniref:secreted RxLR effector protein 161-like n=1 Tax=Miscanthus floridulus TaxID=154761 RepID=UPI003457BC78
MSGATTAPSAGAPTNGPAGAAAPVDIASQVVASGTGCTTGRTTMTTTEVIVPVTNAHSMRTHGKDVADPSQYRSLVGALQYLTFTRPDIAYAVQQVCLYIHDPREPHLSALKRILRYLQGTLDLGLHLHWTSPADLTVYTDADWAGCPNTRKSTAGYAVFLGNNLISWSSKHQPTVSQSSAEAEYRAVTNGVVEACWLRQLLIELRCPLHCATVVYCDNISAVYLSTNPVQHQRTKHIEIDLHFVRE